MYVNLSTEPSLLFIACRAAIDGAFNYEKKCLDLQNGLDYIMQRKEESTKKINKLEKEVRKAENATDTLVFERRRMEATIREILHSFKNKQLQG